MCRITHRYLNFVLEQIMFHITAFVLEIAFVKECEFMVQGK